MIALRIMKFTEVNLHSSYAVQGSTSLSAQQRHQHVVVQMELRGRGKGTQEVLHVTDGVDVNTFPGLISSSLSV